MTNERIEAAQRRLRQAQEQFFNPAIPDEDIAANLHPDIDVFQTEAAGLTLACAPPFIHDLYMGERENAWLNARYELKRALYEQDLAEKKFRAILWTIVQRPYRVNVLDMLKDQMSDREYWDLLGAAWTDSENCYQNLDLWRDLFTLDRPEKKYIMQPEERIALDALPDPIPVYHGVDGSEFAWSTERKVAEWFARRFPHKTEVPILRSGMAPKEHVIAHFLGRNEAEILILREHVLDEKEQVLLPKGDKPDPQQVLGDTIRKATTRAREVTTT